MKRGRRPNPSAQRRLEGNPGRRKFNPHEPVLPTADDAPPIELDDVATAEWRRLLPLLKAAHVVTEGDRGSLLALCQMWSRYLEAFEKVKTSGMVLRSPSGYPMPNPYIGIANKALGNCIKLWVELGLTPSARSRVTTSPGSGATFPDASDPFAEFDAPPTTRPQ